METNHAAMVKSLTSVVADENIAFWEERKKELTLYADATTQIANCCNFTTAAQVPKGEVFTCAKLSFQLSIPACVKRMITE